LHPLHAPRTNNLLEEEKRADMIENDFLNPKESFRRILSIDVLRGIVVLGILIMNIQSFSMPYWPQEIVDIAIRSWNPDELEVQHYLEVFKGSWLEQTKFRVQSSLSNQTKHFLLQTFWRVTALMLLGMARLRAAVG
jgi:uncharacterized membrane protein YeiB